MQRYVYRRPFDFGERRGFSVLLIRLLTPLTLGDYEFENASPYDVDEVIGTMTATGGTSPYKYRIVSETMA